MNLITSALRWLACALLMLVWYPLLMGASFVVPMRRLHGFASFWFRLTLRVLGAKLVIRGLEHLDTSRGYLYVGNHVNLFDPFVFVAAVPQWVVAVEKRPNFKIPIYGWLIARWGNVPIDRDSPTAALRVLSGLVPRLQAGESICLMPEGTRTRNGELGDFKHGPFRIAVEAKAPIVPFALVNMHHFNQTGSFRVRACTVEIVFTPPIESSDYTKATHKQLGERVRAQLLEALGQATDEDEPSDAPPDAVTDAPPEA